MKPAVQLYTVREHTRDVAGFRSSLETIAAIGYPAVQLSAVGAMEGDSPAVDARAAKEMLDENGLECIATHRAWDRLLNHTEEEIAFHRQLGCTYVATGGIPASFGNQGADGYRQFVDQARPVIAQLAAAGIQFGHHNHSHEFQRIDSESTKTLFDILIDQGGDNYLLELDLYWAWHAGVDPAILLARCAGRVPVIHIKDKNVTPDGPGIAAIGEGNLPWARILTACNDAGVRWLAVEQDTCPRDPFDCLRSSYQFLAPLLP